MMEPIPSNKDNDLKYCDGLFDEDNIKKSKKKKSPVTDNMSEGTEPEEKLEYFTE